MNGVFGVDVIWKVVVLGIFEGKNECLFDLNGGVMWVEVIEMILKIYCLSLVIKELLESLK